MRFYFDGQIEGPFDSHRPCSSPAGRTIRDRADVRDLYARLIKTIYAPLFHGGDWMLLNVGGAGDSTNTDLIAYAWRAVTDLAIVAANITGHDAQGSR